MTDGLPQIRSLRVLSDQRLDIVWETGQRVTVDIGELIAQGGVFAPLKDPKIFAMATVDDRHRFVEWRDTRTAGHDLIVDLDADTLFSLARRQRLMGRLARVIQP